MFQNYCSNFKKFSILFYSGGRLSVVSLNKTSFSAIRKIHHNDKPRRAVLYVPGHDQRKIEKIRSLNVDCAVLDCEDGVAANKKEEARQTIRNVAQEFDFGKTEYAVRINSVDSGLAKDDLEILLKAKRIPELIMVPKVENYDHILWLNEEIKTLIASHANKEIMKLIIIIESANSLLDLRDICKRTFELSERGIFSLVGIVFGSDDFCASIGATRTDGASELILARQMIVLIAKSYNMQAIDMVHINYKDLEGLSKMSREGFYMGFTGKQVIHPAQVPIVQESFSPSKEKVEWAKNLIKLFNEHQQSGKGAFTYKGSMIDKPSLLQAEYIIKVAEMCD